MMGVVTGSFWRDLVIDLVGALLVSWLAPAVVLAIVRPPGRTAATSLVA